MPPDTLDGIEQGGDGALSFLGIGRVGGAAGGVQVHPERALLADREPVLRGLAVDQEPAARLEVGGRAGAVRAILLAYQEQQADAPLAAAASRSAAATMAAARPLASQLPRPRMASASSDSGT